jgi:hypothetical protein
VKTRAALAIERIAALGYSTEFADIVVNMVIEELNDPDREMLDAGLEELNLALGTTLRGGDRRELVRRIWQVMLDRAV